MKKAGVTRPFRCVVWRRSDDRHVRGAEAFGGLFHFVGDHVVFGDVAVARFDVDEDVLASLIGSDEAVAFVVVEKLDRSLGHVF